MDRPIRQLPRSHQILIDTGQQRSLEDYDVHRCGEYFVHVHCAFKSFEVLDANGAPCALLVGLPYDTQRGVFFDHLEDVDFLHRFPITGVESIERGVLPALASTFVIVTFGSLPSRVYPDHGGSVPLVFDRRKHVAASSVALMLEDPEYTERLDRKLHTEIILNEGEGSWISGKLTAHVDIFRLLPNHYLDLGSWRSRRFWPTPEDCGPSVSRAEAARVTAEHLGRFIPAMFETFNVSQALTAGYDSRLMLAATKSVRDRAHFFTIETPNGEIDVFIGRELAQHLHLSHVVLESVRSDENDRRLWDRAVGDAVLESNRRMFPTLSTLRSHDYIATGMYGEIGRCRLYRQDHEHVHELRVTAEAVCSRLQLRRAGAVVADLEGWLSELAGFPNSVILDLAFLELKFGSWAVGQRPIQSSIKFSFYPFAQRPLFDVFLRCPSAEKRVNGIFDEAIDLLWPEVMQLPINEYGDYRDKLATLKKLTSPKRVVRFLRDRVGGHMWKG